MPVSRNILVVTVMRLAAGTGVQSFPCLVMMPTGLGKAQVNPVHKEIPVPTAKVASCPPEKTALTWGQVSRKSLLAVSNYTGYLRPECRSEPFSR